MENKVILPVEDNPRDEILTLRALKKSNVAKGVFTSSSEEEDMIKSYDFGANS